MILDVHPLLDALQEARHAAGAPNASTMTLVIFFEEARIADWVRDRTHAIARKHPSRVVIFDGTAAAGDQHAEPAHARGEWVELGVSDVDPEGLAQAMATLALADAPIVLTWLSPAVAHDERFAHLATLAQTVLLSSSAVVEDTSAMRDFIAFVDAHPQIPVQDISYLRLASWQELIAEFFDEEPYAQELCALEEVEIAGGSDAEQFYFLGWLASRLGWTACAQNELCNRDGKIIRFTTAREGPPRRLNRVVLRSAHAEFHAQTTPDDTDAVALEIRGEKARGPRVSPLHSLDIATLVERGILTRRNDPVFAQTLQSVKLLIHYHKG